MTILNEDNLLDQKQEQIPDCAKHAEFYLRALVKHVRESNAPVNTDVRAIPLTSGLRPRTEHRLVLVPTDRRLKHFESLHYARPIGNALIVGYDLVGARRGRGLGGFVDLGGANQRVMDELKELMDYIEQFIIVPAMHETAAAAGVGPRSESSRAFGPSRSARHGDVRYTIDL
jgi:hypothetical protein